MRTRIIRYNPTTRHITIIITIRVTIKIVTLLIFYCIYRVGAVHKIWWFIFIKSAIYRGFGGRKCNFTPKTDLLIFTYYLLSQVGYFPIIVVDWSLPYLLFYYVRFWHIIDLWYYKKGDVICLKTKSMTL